MTELNEQVKNQIDDVFARQQRYALELRKSDYKQRLAVLDRFEQAFRESEEKIYQSAADDFSKPQAAIGASSDLIAISIAAGVVKTIFVTIITPLVAKKIGLDNPSTAMIFGGMIGTTSGVAAGLAATDPKLVPYGALTATFYTGMGVLLCPSVFYLLMVYLL